MSVGLRDIPNAITIARIFLCLPIVLLLLDEQFTRALILFGVAGVSDALDGFLAKRFGWHSHLGSILDPLADKLLLVSSFLALGWLGAIPTWLVALVIGRDVVIVSGAIAYRILFGPYPMAPTLVSKVNTTLQILLVLVVVIHFGPMPLPVWVIQFFIYGVLVTTVLSGIDYVWTWSARALRARRSQRRSN